MRGTWDTFYGSTLLYLLLFMTSQRFISYIRVSTGRQGVSGLGLDAQATAVATYVAGLNGSILHQYVEVESGKTASRPVLQEALAHCSRAKAKLVIAKLDRLSRNVAFVSALMESRVEFVAVDAPFANALMLHIMAAFAQHEREMISERTKAALAAARARGVVLGSHGTILAERHRTEATEFARRLRSTLLRLVDAGFSTLSELAAELNSEGILTREGKKWHPTSVQRVMRRLNLRTDAMGIGPAAGVQECL